MEYKIKTSQHILGGFLEKLIFDHKEFLTEASQ